MGSSVDSDLDVDISVLNTNVLGTISLTKAVLPHMIGEGNGQIVVISSASGKCGKGTFHEKRAATHAENFALKH